MASDRSHHAFTKVAKSEGLLFRQRRANFKEHFEEARTTIGQAQRESNQTQRNSKGTYQSLICTQQSSLDVNEAHKALTRVRLAPTLACIVSGKGHTPTSCKARYPQFGDLIFLRPLWKKRLVFSKATHVAFLKFGDPRIVSLKGQHKNPKNKIC